MSSVKRWTLAMFGVALVALVLAAAPAHAQRFPPGVGGTLNPANYYDPYGNARQAAFNIALYGRAMSRVPPYALGYNPYAQIVNTPYYPPVTPYYGPGYGGTILNSTSGYNSPGYGSPGYGSTYPDGGGYASPFYPTYDPTSSFLMGSAAVMNADGKFRINNQQANLLREQVRSAHIDNKRKAFDEFMYERANTPTWLDELERQRKQDLRYALTSPSGSEILAGSSLNTLLDSLKQMQARNVQGQEVPLDEELLKQINVTAGNGANPGLLKSERFSWPLALTADDFKDDRKNIERNIRNAVADAEHGQAEPARLKNLLADVDRMTDDLGRQIGEMTPTQYIEAKNYLKLLSDAITALGRPDGVNYINGKYAARGKTVGELVKNMAGLKFAQATPGDEQAYKALQEKLVRYYNTAQPSTRSE